jgi:hypothetical protein
LVVKIESDARFDDSRRRVARFFALDPYRTVALLFPKLTIDVPANVGAFYEFRHTVAPDDECSRIAWGLVGPFYGRRPRCTGDTECHDYDYSDDPQTSWVDHCAIPGIATNVVLAIANEQSPTGLPPERDVTRY